MAKPRGRFEREPEPKATPVWTKPLGGPSKASRRDGWSSLALGEQEGLVNAEELQMIRASERVGDLAPVFEGLSEDLQARIGIGRELLRRATYPIMLLLSSAVVGPLPTIVTGSAGSYLWGVTKNVLVIGILGPGLFLAGRALVRHPPLNAKLRTMAWKLPWGAGAYQDRVRAKFARVLGRNIESGLPIFESLETAARITADPHIIARIADVGGEIAQGSELTPALGATGIFESGERMQLVSAERSGTLDATFSVLATHYDERSQRRLQRVVRILSGALTTLIVLYVGMEIVQSYKDAVLGPLELLEQEMPHLKR
jgi:type II secretory pathway component PulF